MIFVTEDLRGVEAGRREYMLSLGDNTVRASRVLDAVPDSYYGGREIGYWARKNWPDDAIGMIDFALCCTAQNTEYLPSLAKT